MTPPSKHLPATHAVRACLRWALCSWQHPADTPTTWSQRAGRRLRLGELDAGPRNPPDGTQATASPAHQPSHGTAASR